MKTRPKRKKISQAEARRLRQQVGKLQSRLQDQIHSYPDGVVLTRITLGEDAPLLTKITTARSLGHPVIVVNQGQQLVYIGLATP